MGDDARSGHHRADAPTVGRAPGRPPGGRPGAELRDRHRLAPRSAPRPLSISRVVRAPAEPRGSQTGPGWPPPTARAPPARTTGESATTPWAEIARMLGGDARSERASDTARGHLGDVV